MVPVNLERLTTASTDNLISDLRYVHGQTARLNPLGYRTKKDFTILHLNVRSIVTREKRLALYDFLTLKSHRFDLVFLNESWLKPTHTNAEIEYFLAGYQIGRAHV